MVPYFFAWIGFAILFLFVCLILYRYRRREINNRANVSSTGYRPRGNHVIVNMTSSDNSSPRYYGQEYVPSNSTSSNQQLPTYRPNNDIAPPPPSYQDYKKDIRLPNSS